MGRFLQFAAGGLMALGAAACWEASSTAPRQDTPALASTSNSIALPRLTGRVVDAANILTSEQELDLTSKSAALEAQTGRQFVVVTVATLNGWDVATFTRDLGNSWRIGRKGHNDGTILLVAPKERKVRIAVGDGLEKTLPDALCKQIIDERMLPRFRQGDLPGGIQAGADALIARLA